MMTSAVVLSFAGSATASIQRSYTGETSQGFGVGARVHVRQDHSDQPRALDIEDAKTPRTDLDLARNVIETLDIDL